MKVLQKETCRFSHKVIDTQTAAYIIALVHGTRYTVHGTRYTVHGTRYTVHQDCTQPRHCTQLAHRCTSYRAQLCTAQKAA